MIAKSDEKTTWVILGTYGRNTYFGRLVRVDECRVYLEDAMKLPWAFEFESMLDYAIDGPPDQNVLPWPKRAGSIAIFRPEEMIECSERAAELWHSMSWIDRKPIVRRISRPVSEINWQDTSGT